MNKLHLKKIIKKPSVIVLITANIVPIVGVIFLDWNITAILFLYWTESGIIGFYNILRMIKIAPIPSIFLVPFFIIHFGGFMFAHLIFIIGITSMGEQFSTSSVHFENFSDLLVEIYPILVAIVALFISHGISYKINFLAKKEHLLTEIRDQMFSPYKRVVLMHITLMIGTFIMITTKSPIGVLLLFIVIKIMVDIRAHAKEHSF